MEPDPIPAAEKRHTVFLGLILALGLLLRLYHVSAPPVDFLSWRDTQTLMIARNFYREGMNLFSPSVDWRTTREAASKGTVGGTELQVVPYLTAALYRVFGLQYWVGRVVPILFALIGTIYFHRLVRRFYGPGCATVSTLLITVSPYYLFCGRVQMPEPFAYAMAFATLYHYDRWLVENNHRQFGLAVAFCALTLLGKPQLGIIAVPMAFLACQRLGRRALITPSLYLFAVLVGVPVSVYMAYSYAVLIPKTGISFASASLLGYRRFLTDPTYYTRVARAVCLYALTPPIAALAAGGLLVRPRASRGLFAHAWTAGALSFFLLMPGGNIANGYYHLVLVPPAVILAARAIGIGWERPRLRVVAALLLIGSAGYSLHVARELYVPRYEPALHCGAWIAENTPKDALVLTADRNPATLYFADRVGWTSWGRTFGEDLINAVIPLGASALAITDEWFDNAYYPPYQDVRDSLYDTFLSYHGADFVVFFLRRPADLSLPEGGRIVFGVPGSRKYLRGTWGPDQGGEASGTFVAMGPAARSGITFATARAPKRIILELASAAPDQEISFQLNGQAAGALSLSNAFERGRAVINCVAPVPSDGKWALTLDAARQNENGASLLLYSLYVAESP